jgi:alpha-ketoglutarate-dependent taurine dioxygenase
MSVHSQGIVPLAAEGEWAREAISIVDRGLIALVRNLSLTETDVLECALRIGEPMKPIALPPGEELSWISKIEDDGEVRGSLNWHVDQSFAQAPPDWTLLFCEEPGTTPVPTVFTDAHKLTTYLSPAFLAFLEGLSADHQAFYGSDVETSSAHPLIVDAEKARTLFVSPATTRRINELSIQESDLILEKLFSMFNWPELTTVHTWSKGDLLIWPNRRYPHRALPFNSGGRRVLFRVVGHWAK